MVRRQRRGDELASRARPLAAITWTPGGGLWDRLVDLFRLPCPTSSATRAQVWLDLKSNGLPVLTIGVTLAIVILLVSAVANPIDAAINADPDVSCPIRECFYWRALPPLLYAALTVRHVVPRRKCLRDSPETRTRVHERIRGDSCARHRTAGRPQGTREVGLRPGRHHRDRRERMDIGATVGRCGLHPDVGPASEQSAVWNQWRHRSADRVRAALTGGRGGSRCRHLGGGVRRVRSAWGIPAA